MNIAPSVQDYLAVQQVAYDVIAHPHTESANGTARAAHVPGARMAKAVVVRDEAGWVLAVLPASRQVALWQLRAALHREALELASEAELAGLFADCAPGAVPPVGPAYGLPVVLEESLAEQPDVFFEAGDHEHVIHMTRAEFLRLMGDAPCAHFGEPAGLGGKTWMQ